ncbi:deoxyguanosinetriphosphate triphosphohydrolase [Methanosalsum zhilinae DSM 4017]|uniref:Deoxyguanosinetriphosphate triphosphohydrolase n=1 Tax=Methanosalsum zhilinae (strain DSM 4017 / NBRC 107636 / OCM 62 / WeN5) TaxID=679901 RepID=F7XLI8_METZD|nr:dNTP triphosphohydrolase [Methanosalsum zhilinae]AEH60795.1 deoxyguanosinetriphosphate triphosphohydrolase [Methanosalsum zhilinae DSM 4017]
MKRKLSQKFQATDRLNQKIEEKLPISCQILEEINRSEFTKDRDRILFSRPFRRLQHKAQVFSNEMGDHYRTRLTHTLEVTQISRSLARYLDANEDLVEAIALGHDIGHAPFGHQGERVLDEVMSGTDKLGLIRYPLNFGGFKHNYNCLRVLDVVQLKFEDHEGLNLSWQVLEGILKHTKIDEKRWDIRRFLSDDSLIESLYLDKKYSVTLEGQIVSIADEIAQRQHDIDDGLRNKELGFELDKLYGEIIEIIDKIILKESQYEENDKEHLQNLIELLTQVRDNIIENRKSKSRLFKTDNLVRNMIEYFILDVFANSHRNILKENPKLSQDMKRNILQNQVISFSPLGRELNIEIEKLVKYRILNSYQVNKFDGKSRFVIRQLFKAFYTNPLQMPSYVLSRLTEGLIKNSDIYVISFEGENGIVKLNDVDYNRLSRSEVNTLNNSLKLEDLMRLEIPSKLKNMIRLEFEDIEKNEEFYEKLKSINSTESYNLTGKTDKFLKCLAENHYVYLSTICDYIAGMSDNYANEEYKKLYLID